MAEYAISGDVATLAGDDHTAGDPAALWVESSAPILVDSTTGRVGGRLRVTLEDDGTFSQTGLPETVSGASPLYRLVVDSLSLRRAGNQRGITTGWFPLEEDRDLTWIIANYVEVTPITTELATQIAAAAALGDNNNTMTASFITGAGATQTALDTRIAAEVDPAYVRGLNPAAHGAAGDDTTDDTTELQAAITAAATAGLALDLRGLTYKTTASLTVPANSRITNGTIHCTGTGVKILNVTGSNVTLSNLTIKGRHATATYAANEFGIYVEGSASTAFVSDIHIQRVKIMNVGDWGIVLKWVEDFRVESCDLKNIGYMGIGTLSARRGTIDRSLIDTVVGNGAADAYGIALSRSAEVASFVTAPLVENVTVSNNIVRNVPWEGIDCHGGSRLTFIGNVVAGCKTGIAIVGDDAEGNVQTYAAKQVVVANNVIDSAVTNGTAGPGIVIAGAPATSGLATDPAMDYATATVIGNVIRNHGASADNLSGALYMRNTLGTVVSGNKFENSSPTAVCLYYDNRALTISGNTFLDNWSSTITDVSAVTGQAANNIGVLIASNTLRTTGLKSATTINRYGVLSLAASNEFVVGPNVFSHATTRYSGSGLPAANPDTSGAALGALETEVNELKATLRLAGLIGT